MVEIKYTLRTIDFKNSLLVTTQVTMYSHNSKIPKYLNFLYLESIKYISWRRLPTNRKKVESHIIIIKFPRLKIIYRRNKMMKPFSRTYEKGIQKMNDRQRGDMYKVTYNLTN